MNVITSIVVVVGLYLFIWKQRIGDLIVWILETVFDMKHEAAFYYYNDHFRGNKEIFFAVAVLQIFTVLMVRIFRWVTGYFREVNQGIESLLADDEKQIQLSPEMLPFERNLVLVNYENAIPDNYEPKLVEVPGGEKVDERIYDPLMEMLEAAKEGNWDQLPMVVSGYRTQEKQQQLYDDKVAGYRKEGNSQSEAEELAKQWVSVPGYSEHQIGLAVDINGATYDLYFWLQENSYKYGFIFRYPGDKTDITGVAEEVWHYRYVGVEAATEMYEEGLCLEEYLAERQAYTLFGDKESPENSQVR